MCGIAGIFDRVVPHANLRATAIRMADQLVRRGPDAGGVRGDDGVALSHRRLSILDLSESGAQPMQSACDRFVIAFNGEIYSHRDLRQDIEAAGAAPLWRSHSDTEALLAAVEHWGLDETLRRAAGMFVIALRDRQERRPSLVRDRMGEKPLCWGWAGPTMVFGSELKALRQHPDFPWAICREATAQHLRFGYRSLVTVWTSPEALVLGATRLALLLDDPLPAELDNGPAARMMAQDMRSNLPDDILCKADRAAMGISLESRAPFLDPDVIAFSARLPMQTKIRGTTGKWALRQILYRHVPRELLERAKIGFGITLGDWLRGSLRDWAADLLLLEKLGAEGLLDAVPVRYALAEHLSGRRDWTHRIWTILMLQARRERW